MPPLSLVKKKKGDAMTDDYFVMLNTQRGGIAPLMKDDEIATFPSLELAKQAGKANLLGSNFGFEVFYRGEGEAF